MLTQDEFSQLLQALLSAWHQGEVTRAFTAIESILREGTPEMKGQGLFYRGIIRKSQGALVQSRQDWLDALCYASEGSFMRYELEHNLGEAFEDAGSPDEAVNWYRIALKTCCKGDEFSGNRTLPAFLRLKGKKIDSDDKRLVACVIEKSWRVLEIPGIPDLKDLTRSVGRLTEAFSNRVSEIIEKS